MRNSSAQNWNGARFSWSTLNRAQITGLHFALIKKEIVRRIMSHNKLKKRNASLLKNTQPLFCFQNKLPFDLEKVTYVTKIGKISVSLFLWKTTFLPQNESPFSHHWLSPFFSLKGFFFTQNSQNEFFRFNLSFFVVTTSEFFTDTLN